MPKKKSRAVSNYIGGTIKAKAYESEKIDNIQSHIKRLSINEIAFVEEKDIDIEKLNAIKALIKSHSLPQYIITRHLANGTYVILDGRYRYLAYRELGRKAIYCYVIDHSHEQKILKQDLNLIQEKMLSPLEKARILLSLKNNKDEKGKNYSVKKICSILSVSRKTFYRYSHVFDLSDGLQKMVDNRMISTASIERINNYLSHSQQAIIEEYILKRDKKLSANDINKIIDLAKTIDTLSINSIDSVVI